MIIYPGKLVPVTQDEKKAALLHQEQYRSAKEQVDNIKQQLANINQLPMSAADKEKRRIQLNSFLSAISDSITNYEKKHLNKKHSNK